jgi:heat shock protein HtpX
MANNVKTVLLLGLLTGIILFIGSFWGQNGLTRAIIVAPIAAMLIQMWISRTREYQADASGAEIAGSPHGLASALQKLGNYSKRIPMEASPSTAHMYIMHPFSGGTLMNLFSTHPPTEKRIERLLGRG